VGDIFYFDPSTLFASKGENRRRRGEDWWRGMVCVDWVERRHKERVSGEESWG
jgi:hypothetical protein